MPQDNLFRGELVTSLDQRHPLVKLADWINWSIFDKEGEDLFASTTGRPAAAPGLSA